MDKPSSQTRKQSTTEKKPKRPWSLIFFAVWIAILGGVNLMRAAILFQQIPLLAKLGIPTNWTVAILGTVWGVGLVAGAVGLWFRWEPARWAILLLVPAHYLTQWLYSMLTTQASYGQGQIWPYTVFALLVITYSTWFLTRRPTRQQFKK